MIKFGGLARSIVRSEPGRTPPLPSQLSRYHVTARRSDSHHHHQLLLRVLQVHDEVADAVDRNRPVVALESAIYTHGALGDDLGLEEIVRDNGAIPAVVGIVDGVPKVGITKEERAYMVRGGDARKASRRDLAYLVGKGITGDKMNAGTTIAGTMVLARLAGIRVFGTGGLGGVHRHGQDSMDISADLTELGRTRIAVVSSGCKGFLDIGRTLEFLETQGVPVSTFSDESGRGPVDFPAFWTRESGFRSPLVVRDEREAAAMFLAQEGLGIETGLLFANPIPEGDAISRTDMEMAVKTAAEDADRLGFVGSANTPFVLQRIGELTGGRSVAANKALVRANVGRAARIAVELCRMMASGRGGHADQQADSARISVSSSSSSPPSPPLSLPRAAATATTTTTVAAATARYNDPDKADILVAGSVAVDLSCDYARKPGSAGDKSPQLHTSNPASIKQSIGGVGHNVALAAHLVTRGASRVKLCSLVGDDIAGRAILGSLAGLGLDTGGIHTVGGGAQYPAGQTAQYVAVNDADKNLVMAMADMDIFTRHSFADDWARVVAKSRPEWVVVDGNWGERDIRAWILAGKRHACKVAFEPVSVLKSRRLFDKAGPGPGRGLALFPDVVVDLASPNGLELAAMYETAKESGYFESMEWFRILNSLSIGEVRSRLVRLASRQLVDSGIPVQAIHLLPYIPTILTKLGPDGVLLATLLRREDPRLRSRASERYILARAGEGDSGAGGIYMRLFPAAEQLAGSVVSVNGAGDTFLGVLIAGLARGGAVEDLVDIAQRAAVLTLRGSESVSREIGRLEGELGWGDAARG